MTESSALQDDMVAGNSSLLDLNRETVLQNTTEVKWDNPFLLRVSTAWTEPAQKMQNTSRVKWEPPFFEIGLRASSIAKHLEVKWANPFFLLHKHRVDVASDERYKTPNK